jgi:hypothetical protein
MQKPTNKLRLGDTKQVIYSYLSTSDLILKISKLSKKDRKMLLTADEEIMQTRNKLKIDAVVLYLDIFK